MLSFSYWTSNKPNQASSCTTAPASFSVWRPKQFVTKNHKYSREFILKLIYIYGPHIKDTKQVGKETWISLCADAREKRLNVDDVMNEKW